MFTTQQSEDAGANIIYGKRQITAVALLITPIIQINSFDLYHLIW